jgi:signal transduction histidine kinase
MSKDKPRGSQSAEGRRTRPLFRLRGLRVQIVLWTVLPVTLVLIGVAFTGVYSHEQAMRDLVQERDRALAEVSAGQVRAVLQERAMALEALAAEQAFHHREAGTQRALLAEAGDLNGLFAGDVALVDETGSPLLTGAEVPTWLRSTDGIGNLARTVMARQSPALSQPDSDGVFLVGVPVRDETGSAYGLLAGPVALDHLDLEILLSRVQVGDHGVVYLTDASGRILAHSQSEQARSSLAGHTGLETALQDDGAGVTLCHAPDGEQMTLAYAPVVSADSSAGVSPGVSWRVIIEQPWQEVIGPVLRYSQFMPLVAVLASIVSVLALYYGVGSIVRPLQALGQQAERVAWGDFEATGSPVGGVEEIEDLRRTLDQMAGRIQSYQRGMHDYIAAITEGQEEERKRLARELHDDTAQALIALRQQVEAAQKLVAHDPERAAERLAQVRTMLAETLEGVRRFGRDLRPIYLEDLGLLPAVEMLSREADQQENLSVQLTISGTARRLPPDLELATYRIVQEAVNNVVQHANANQAWVAVRFETERLILSVRDDGLGFEAPDLPDALARRGHFGLMGIQERTFLYGGKLVIHSAPGEGTELTVHVPYPTSD